MTPAYTTPNYIKDYSYYNDKCKYYVFTDNHRLI